MLAKIADCAGPPGSLRVAPVASRMITSLAPLLRRKAP